MHLGGRQSSLLKAAMRTAGSDNSPVAALEATAAASGSGGTAACGGTETHGNKDKGVGHPMCYEAQTLTHRPTV